MYEVDRLTLIKKVYNTNFKTDLINGKAKLEAVKAFKDWLTFFSLEDIVVYSDRSKYNDEPGISLKISYS